MRLYISSSLALIELANPTLKGDLGDLQLFSGVFSELLELCIDCRFSMIFNDSSEYSSNYSSDNI